MADVLAPVVYDLRRWRFRKSRVLLSLVERMARRGWSVDRMIKEWPELDRDEVATYLGDGPAVETESLVAARRQTDEIVTGSRTWR